MKLSASMFKFGWWVLLLIVPCALLEAQTPKLNDLDHSKWELAEITDRNIPDEADLMVSFEGAVLSVSGCNLSSGNFRIDAEKLVLAGPLRSTRRACSAPLQSLDDDFSKLLAESPTVHVVRTQMTLQSSAGVKWSFQRVALASKDAETRFIYVGAFTKNCTGSAPMKCLEVRDSPDQPWRLHYSGIIGFEHVPGIEYRLRIKEDRVANAPADSSSMAWYLDAVIEQTVVDREAADKYLAGKTDQH